MSNSHRPTLCIVAGPNGSGKTTTTIQLLANEWSDGCLYINPDNIAQEVFGDWNSPDSILKAAELAAESSYIKNHFSILQISHKCYVGYTYS